MKFLSLFLPLLLCCACGKEKTGYRKTDNISPDSNTAVTVSDTIVETDTVGCVLLNTKQDTVISKDGVSAHLVIETYCTDQAFWDTTYAAGGKGLNTHYKRLGLYNYREIKITMDVGGETDEILLDNETFKKSVSDDFYTRGMLNYIDNVEVSPKDTSLKFRTCLFVPGDARVVISAAVNRKGEVKVLSTSYEGAY